MKKTIDIKNIKISPSILLLIILLLILVCSFVLFFEVNDYRNIREQTYNFYYYFGADKIDFTATVFVNVDDKIMSIRSDNATLTSSPIYFKNDSTQVILANNMEIVFPYKNNPMYKLGNFSKIYTKNNYLYINSEAGNGRLYDCFLYDGEDLYLFLENTTVFINEERYELSPMSFIEVTKSYIRMYDKKNDNYTFIDGYTGGVSAYTDEYTIDLSGDTFTYNNLYFLLIKNIDGLSLYEF